MHEAPSKPVGLREQKRRQTFQRIADAGLKSFLSKGYQATTLDEIAAAAGISRRTFFYYFKSKDEILLAQQHGYMAALKASIVENGAAGRPIDIVQTAIRKLVARLETPQLLATARLMRDELIRVRTRGGYLQLEQTAYEGLCEVFPTRSDDELRLLSMVLISPLRLSVDRWIEDDGKRPLIDHVEDAFAKLRAEI
ncbi:MAG: helix-turn-helix domain-containing protein [Rhizobium sp.]